MELKQVPKIEKFLFTIQLTRHMDDGTVEPTGVNFKLQLSPNRSEEDIDVDIIRLLLSAVDSVASRSILTDKGPNYRHPLLGNVQKIEGVEVISKEVSKLLAHRYLYYVICHSIISDYEYDILEKSAIENKAAGYERLLKPGSSLAEDYPDFIKKEADFLLNRHFSK